MALEYWRPVSGYDNEYEVSSIGRVRSLPRYRKGKGGKPVRVNGRILKHGLMGSGYPSVSLGSGNSKYVHRLVAASFVPNPEGFTEVNHKDGDKSNNAAKNLEWVSREENMNHASNNGLLATGENHGRNTKPEAFNVS